MPHYQRTFGFIKPGAVDRYLDYVPKPPPPFKGMPTDELQRWIESCGAPYEPIGAPSWPHQMQGLAFALWAEQAMLFFDTRIGKSKISLDWARMLRRSGRWKNLGLIIAHAPVGLDVWEDEIARFSDLKCLCVRSKTELFLDAIDSDIDLIVVPWSGIQTIFSVRGMNRKQQVKLYPDRKLLQIAAQHFGLCIMDEIHMCMHPRSLRFRMAAELTAQCKFRLGLTGTPVGRSGYGIWAQSFLVDHGRALGNNYYFFEQAFGRKTHSFKDHVEWRFDHHKIPLLRDKLSRVSLPYKREEIYQVDVRRNTVSLHMRGDQREAYEALVEDVITMHMDDVEIRGGFMRLRQIASGYLSFVDNDGIRHQMNFRHNVKLEWLQSFLADQWDKSPIVIYHEFIRSGEMLCKLLEKLHIKHRWLYGGTTDTSEAVRAFQLGTVNVLVANTIVGGVGINLSRADHMIWFEPCVRYISRAQAEARPLASSRGTRPLWMDDLFCAPIEHRIAALLSTGKNVMEGLTTQREQLRVPAKHAAVASAHAA